MSTRFTRVTVALAALVVVAGCGAGAGSPSAPASEAASAPRGQRGAVGGRVADGGRADLRAQLPGCPAAACVRRPGHRRRARGRRRPRRDGGDLRGERARWRRRPDRVGRGRRHRHGHPGRVGPQLAVRARSGRSMAPSSSTTPITCIGSSRPTRRSRSRTSSWPRPASGSSAPGRPARASSRRTSRSAPRTTSLGLRMRFPPSPAVPHERRGDGRRARSRSHSKSSISPSSRAPSTGRRTRSTTSPPTTSRKSRTSSACPATS